MSIVNGYRDQFSIAVYDDDLPRGAEICQTLKMIGYQAHFYSDCEFAQSDAQWPHMLLAFYQPLSVTFRKKLKKVREASDEIEIVVLGANDFWPGIKSLIAAKLADDFWAWPMASPDSIRL